MPQLHEVDVPPLSVERLRPLIGDTRTDRLERVAGDTRRRLDGSTVWNVNSTATGGGVAEMLEVLVGYARGMGIDCRWLVLEGDAEFFAVTKRIHNRLHGMVGDGGDLGRPEADHVAAVSAANAPSLLERVRPGDVVVLHDPQTAGLAPWLAGSGVHVVWRSHIGVDHPNRWTEQALHLLRPALGSCDAFVFTRSSYVPPWVPPERVSIIPPSIDPLSAKNQSLDPASLPSFLDRIGLTSGPGDRATTFRRQDGSFGEVVRRAAVVAEGDPPASLDNLVVQVSRWDRLKDMAGVMTGFADHVVGGIDAHLALVGPSTEGVADDPEGAGVYAACVEAWRRLPVGARRRIRLVSLPMDDVEENAAMVNAIQRAATVVVQKSLVEGFGLTVAEGMWKGRPVVASGVGGIVDQVRPGTGVLLDDPGDLDAFGKAVADLLRDPEEIARLGANAHRLVREEYLGDKHLLRFAELLARLRPV